jgi:uncharacterized protein
MNAMPTLDPSGGYGPPKSLKSLCALVALAAVIALAGCASSPPLRYYTLQAPATERAAPAAPFAFALQAVRVPPQVDVAPLMVREGAASLVALEGHHWGAPLAMEWRVALSTALRDAHGGIDLARAGLALAPDVPVLRVDVQRFDAEAGARVHASGVWSVGQTEPAIALNCAFALEAPAGALPADIANAHQQLIARLANQMAATLAGLRTGREARCPG